MPSISDTAYPWLKSHPSAEELDEVYTPNEQELAFAQQRTRRPEHRVGLLLLLKTFQRLGYFARYGDIPAPIVGHIAHCAGSGDLAEAMKGYDADLIRRRHTDLVLEFLGVTAYGPMTNIAAILGKIDSASSAT